MQIRTEPETGGTGSPPEPLRVLMVSDVYFPRINGVSTSIQTFRDSLEATGARVDLLVPAYPNAPAEEPDEIFRQASRSLFFDVEDRMMSIRLTSDRRSRLDERAYQVIHVHTPFMAQILGQTLKKRWGCPLVVTYHTHFEDYLAHYLPWLPARGLRTAARMLTRWQCGKADAIVAPTQSVAEVLQRYGIHRPVRVIATGLPEDRYRKGDGSRFRREHAIPEERPMLLFVGRVAHEKNVDFLLQVVRKVRERHPDILLVIAGEGPARAHLERSVGELGLDDHVRFVGYLDRRDALQDCYAAGDVFVFASKTETQGLVLLEAMAAGTPVVALAELGTRDVLAAGTGALVAPEDAGAFAAQVGRVLEDPLLRDRMETAAVMQAREWSADAKGRTLLELYRSLAAPRVE